MNSRDLEMLLKHKYQFADPRELADPMSIIGNRFRFDMQELEKLKIREAQTEAIEAMPEVKITSVIKVK